MGFFVVLSDDVGWRRLKMKSIQNKGLDQVRISQRVPTISLLGKLGNC